MKPFWGLSWILSGAALGVLAWGEGRAPAAAFLLPLLAASAPSRLQAFMVGLGYCLGTLRYSPFFIAGWFDGSLLVGATGVAAYAVITGAAWCLAWSSSPHPARRAIAVVVATLLALLPPVAAGLAGHPLIAMGYLAPGSGWFGVGISLLLPALIVWVLASRRAGRQAALAGLAAATIGLAGAGLAIGEPPPRTSVNGVHAMRTALGPLRDQDEALARIEMIGRTLPHDRAVVTVWPESVIGRYEPAMYRVLDLEVLAAARAAGRVQVIGLDIPMRGERLLNSAVAFYPDGTSATATARQPAPISLWRPWRSTDTFVADWRAQNMLNLGQGDRAAVIFCYEEYMPTLYLLNEILDEPTVYLAMANTWAASYPAAAAIQTSHSYGMARLFGRPYLKAENRPIGPESGGFGLPLQP